jgi:hypothetical protein
MTMRWTWLVPSQVDGFAKNVLLAILQPASGHNIDLVTQQLFEFLDHPHHVEERTFLAEVDQKINIAVRAIVTTGA